ncbi:MBL fold metallo-hydrolase [Actinobacillus equuli subsp. equuli]|uniref:Beta-lactamase domain-containing protein n=1 Tax=Actinobacillus equuli TaxID=718 RepID=A0AAX3FL93_ACTEU|nr:MBL fold metallo-hydrolase [Actinobacillus equuli]AIZ79744.1 beta-lactamase [Actinobacillus equuli subsp. equuli]WGE43853.1 MBL fold metallo-hydrolase [Actinobacillus equuli subsp. equuli]WGE48107.1 MBL fold metallo-hydrolase [Actinobacillus equuli subsp. equuli]WGE50195.1 MBL fold metallo-hydrolase [Actinobacillus equuli subsp. haemolyticus]WGE52301.1 MBL fold metallo-hydrolase [Actinobacillus equuli subsp. haemolyticus]
MTLNKFIKTAITTAMMATFTQAVIAETAHTHTSTTQANEQVAGFYRMQLGDLLVTALYDGPVNVPHKWIHGISADEMQAVFDKMFLPRTADGIQTAVNAFLIKQPSGYTLIDAGAAKCYGDTLGHIVENLKASGVQPEEVKNIVVTHLHSDHACGVATTDGKMAFPNATLYAPKKDADFWLSKEIAAQQPKEVQIFFDSARQAVTPYQAAGQFKTFNEGENPIEGIETVQEFGHSPGMTGYLVGSGKDRLLVWGDIIHSHTIQLKNPDISMEVDSDEKAAIATRKRILKLVSEGKLWVGAAHIPFPGIGHIVKEEQGYSWVPVQYLPLENQ